MQALVITSAGEALVAQLVSGVTTARFTRLCASCKDYSEFDGDSLKRLSALDGIRQSAEISGVRRVDERSAEILAAMDNRAVNEGYYTRTIGLYAEDEGGNEVLFAVCTEDDVPFYMPSFSGGAVSGVSYKLKVKVSNSAKINAEVSTEVYATAVQLEDEVRQLNERIDALSFDDDIAAHNADADSHPKLLALLNGLSERLALLEKAAGEEITANPFAVIFETLESITADGVFVPASMRLEF